LFKILKDNAETAKIKRVNDDIRSEQSGMGGRENGDQTGQYKSRYLERECVEERKES